MKIPRHSIDRVREIADIVDVVSGYVRLRKRGKNYFGLCPFHQEKTPSFSVNAEKQIFHCFGCGKGGNVFTFLMEYEKITFFDAVKKLADQYNIRLEYEETDAKKEYEIGLLYDIHLLAADYFMNNLYSETGKKALEYMESRGFREETLRTFRIGYSLRQGEALFRFLKENGYKENTILKSGLVIRTDDGRYYDRFRHRVMFPIVNIGSRIIAFAGRALDKEEKAKYINSPETGIYSKSHILFGLEQAKENIRRDETVVIVEGYTDLMKLHQSGIRNVVAGSGTAFTAGHARLLGRFVHTCYLCYDADEAGQKASLRAGLILLKEGLSVKVINLPEKHDPDSFIDEKGKDEFVKLINSSTDFAGFLSKYYQDRLGNPREKSALVQELSLEFSDIRDSVIRNSVIKQISAALGIDENILFQRIKRIYRQKVTGKAVPEDTAPKALSASEKAEVDLLRLLLSGNREIVNFVRDNFSPPGSPQTIFSRMLGKILADDTDPDIHHILDNLNSEDERRILTELAVDMELPENPYRLAVDCMVAIENEILEKEINRFRQELKEAEKQKTDALAILKKIQEKQIERSRIKERYTGLIEGERGEVS